jgi:hypothetical protein
MTAPLDDEDPIYYGHIADQMRATLTNDPREPEEWSDGDKLRLLAGLFDQADLLKGNPARDVQNDLRRIAERLDIADLP